VIILVKLVVVGLLAVASAAKSDEPVPYVWVKPTFAASIPLQKNLKIESSFEYHLYKPNNATEKVRLVRRKYASNDNAELALSSRMSAIASLDYSWWLDTWTTDSKTLALDYYASKGLDKAYWLAEWKEQFVGRNITLRYKVEYGDYVVMIYNVAQPNGKPSYLDLPLVFTKEQGDWLVSLELRANPLIHFSPWISGKDKELVSYE
tara:strand:- start:3367 stop:3984 length:618 start_codon:yes stop_codon:yes gene_type:complete